MTLQTLTTTGEQDRTLSALNLSLIHATQPAGALSRLYITEWHETSVELYTIEPDGEATVSRADYADDMSEPVDAFADDSHPLDTASSASVQHFIDTGRYMREGDTVAAGDMAAAVDRMAGLLQHIGEGAHAMQCNEAESIADVLRIAGHDTAAARLITAHAAGDDDPDDDHRAQYLKIHNLPANHDGA